MKAAIILFPGSNREIDMAKALKTVSGIDPVIVWHKDTSLPACDLMVLPGGFSYGDYLRCGSMAAHSPIMKDVIARAQKGTRLLAVCNGFQMLVETKLVPGALIRNRSLHFRCQQTHLRVENNQTDFTSRYKTGQIIRVPIAHGEGNYIASQDDIKMMNDNGQIAFRYCDSSGAINDESNPNGSTDNIAGVFNSTKTIMGMMPHPEDAVAFPSANHDGKPLFQSIFEALA
jgi:phosphoribosylformylglycinamidine synthase I